MKKMADKSGSMGIAGEFFVAAELTRRGYVASLTSKNTKAIDILASNKDGSKSVAIQVKTCDNAKINKWKMSDSVEWYHTPGKHGQQRNSTTMRTFTFADNEDMNQYKNAWHLLGL